VQRPRAIVANLADTTVDERADDNRPRGIDRERVELMAAGKTGENSVTIGAAGSEERANVAVGGRHFPWRDDTAALNLTCRCLCPVEHRPSGDKPTPFGCGRSATTLVIALPSGVA
jgi:hypothetical protein